MNASPAYAELAAASNYSFLRSASHPGELVATAAELNYAAIGIADRNTLAGVVRAHVAAKEAGLKLLVGARLVPEDGPEVLCYPADRAAYGRLTRLLTLGKRRARKGACSLGLADLLAHAQGQTFIVMAPENLDEAFRAVLTRLGAALPGACFLAGQVLYRGDDARRLARLAELAEACGTPLVACSDARMHAAERKALLDVVTCIREHCTIDQAGFRLEANAERHLKSPAEMARLFRDYPDAVARTLEIAERCRFNLDELRYEYPDEMTGAGRTPQEELAHLTGIGAQARYPQGVPATVRATLDHELALIGELGYAPYFLTVYDIVRFARAQGILCQGRGSAANSAVCYCLGITAVDPARVDLLFERFVSTERNEPPDIDVDFEHERREEVIQYIYAKYGRERAGLTAVVISYRGRSAIREVAKAMGLSADTVSVLATQIWGRGRDGVGEEELRAAGLDPDNRRLQQTLALTRALIGFPRHLSQHVGGFVMTRGRLDELVPIENAAMADRTVIEWDKDDIDALGILKVDVLGLGMLTCLRKGFDLLAQYTGVRHDLASVPAEDPAVYDMLCKADSLGVFQVESRAQMSMLPRLKPRNFYDLVIEVAIVRPGPIQGDMVHPYLRRRNGEEKVSYPSKDLEAVLGKTLGVPLFQEQAMKIAIVAADFTPSEADRLRRAMATFRRVGTIHSFEVKLVEGMVANGYDRDFATRCFRQIEGFGDYGFPESHAASFALLVYVSSWLKCHHPAIFAAALLNSQPMGFYAPAQIVRDAREHGVEVRAPDVNDSERDCTLEPVDRQGACFDTLSMRDFLYATQDRLQPQPVEGGGGNRDTGHGTDLTGGATRGLALRLGLRQIKGLAEAEARALVAARGAGYADPLALWRRAGLGRRALEALARADAFRSQGLARREALWTVKALPAGEASSAPLPLFAAAAAEEIGAEPQVGLPAMSLGEHVVDDYASLRLSLKAHPVSFLRADLRAEGMIEAARLIDWPNHKRVKLAGLVLVRQRPGTAKGVIFATLEDETGVANVIVWPDVFVRYRKVVLGASLLGVEGPLQREGLVIHIIAQRIVDLSPRLAQLQAPLTHADEVKRPPRDLGKERAEAKRLYRSRNFH